MGLIQLPVVVYFDTNVFHEIVKRDSVGAGLQRKLRICRERGGIVVPASLVVANELVDGIGSENLEKAERSRAQLRAQWQICDWKSIIHQMETLATGEIGAYARGEPSPNPFLEGDDFHTFLRPYRALFDDLDRKPLRELAIIAQIIADNRKQKSSFAAVMNEGKGKAAEEILDQFGSYPSFQQVWDDRSRSFAEGFARRAMFSEECRTLGFEGLLERPIVRVGVAAYMALWYTHEFPLRGPTRAFKGSDSRDMHHLVSAVAARANVLVCQEKPQPAKLPGTVELLREHSLVDLRVVDLDDLLRELSL
jgi:hypothetical protein